MKTLEEQIEYINDKIWYHEQESESCLKFYYEKLERYKTEDWYDVNNEKLMEHLKYQEECAIRDSEHHKNKVDMYKSIVESLKKI